MNWFLTHPETFYEQLHLCSPHRVVDWLGSRSLERLAHLRGKAMATESPQVLWKITEVASNGIKWLQVISLLLLLWCRLKKNGFLRCCWWCCDTVLPENVWCFRRCWVLLLMCFCFSYKASVIDSCLSSVNNVWSKGPTILSHEKPSVATLNHQTVHVWWTIWYNQHDVKSGTPPNKKNIGSDLSSKDLY